MARPVCNISATNLQNVAASSYQLVETLHSKRVKIAPKEASLGLGFGSSSSKMTLAHTLRINDEEGVTNCRVPVNVDLGHPDRFSSGLTNHEFISFAALVDGRLEFGRSCLNRDSSIPLKTMFTYLAGINSKEKLHRLPGGRDLYEACNRTSGPGMISKAMISDVLWRYFGWLRDQALVQAKNMNVVIKRLILTYPAYLRGDRDEDVIEEDVTDKYMSLYRRLILPLWHSEDVTVHFVGEGQAAGLYVCEPIYDSYNTFQRSSLWNFLQDPVQRNKPLHIAIFDNGGSTLNLQLQSIYFDEEGNFLCSQCNAGDNWRTGTFGGSYLSNECVKMWIRATIEEKNWPTSELAIILKRFEEEKCALDAKSFDKDIILIGSDPNYFISVPPEIIRKSIRAAFRSGFKTLGKEVDRLLDLGNDFAVVLCGGSYCNPLYRGCVEDYLRDVQRRGEERGMQIKHAVLANFDGSGWQSAVSAGAAISVWPLPSPYDVFLGSSVGRSAIGIQRLKKGTGRFSGTIIGSTEVKVLLSAGCDPLSSFTLKSKKNRSKSIYRLICDPKYGDERGQARIKLGKSDEEILNGPICPYDLGFEIEAQ
ncbi:hypothetical protein NPX13_g1825 [Xylaria arbuscula]|uniref:Uncharacterized protein n=1 Tax=Xylaria arbuscula TaxID=114810 RepID=A0A9W8TQY8_9PEZI|nr:hypothetical protein NPX13_g1825 [Xylaria arbuscula]